MSTTIMIGMHMRPIVASHTAIAHDADGNQKLFAFRNDHQIERVIGARLRRKGQRVLNSGVRRHLAVRRGRDERGGRTGQAAGELRRAQRKAGRVGSGDLDAARILDTGHGSRKYGRLGGQKQSRVNRACGHVGGQQTYIVLVAQRDDGRIGFKRLVLRVLDSPRNRIKERLVKRNRRVRVRRIVCHVQQRHNGYPIGVQPRGGSGRCGGGRGRRGPNMQVLSKHKTGDAE